MIFGHEKVSFEIPDKNFIGMMDPEFTPALEDLKSAIENAIDKANEIASTVPPVGIAILPPKLTLKRARHWQLVTPFKVINPLPSLWAMEQFPLVTVSVKRTF